MPINILLIADKLFNARVERIVFFMLIILHLIIYFTVATDNNGDPNEYLDIARSLFAFDAPMNANRFFGYPLFIYVSSLGLTALNITFLAQHIFFIIALRLFAKKITAVHMLRFLIYLPAFVPAIAYLPNLLFPDSLILSLLLLFSANIYSKNFIRAGMFACCLCCIKLVFVFLLFLTLALSLREGGYNRRLASLLILIILPFFLITAAYKASPFALYQSVVQRPIFLNDEVLSATIPVPYEFVCDAKKRVIVEKAIIANFTEHSSDLRYLPIGPAISTQYFCSIEDIKNIQRHLVTLVFTQAPWEQSKKLVRRWVKNMFVFSDHAHVGYMLSIKYQLLKSYYSFSQYYESTQLESFKSQGMSPIRLPNQTFLGVLNSLNQSCQHLISVFIVICASLGAMSLMLFKNLELSLITPLLLVISFYSFCIAVFAFGYDRYIFINYFLWMGVIAVGFRQIVGALSVNTGKT
jgi:hypothetical protein